MRARWRAFALLALAAILFGSLLSQRQAQAGGPLGVGGGSAGFGVDALPFTWDMTGGASPLVSGGEIQYRTDGGKLGLRTNLEANNSVQGMFQVWEDVSRSNVAFNRAGSLLATGGFTDGNVSTAPEFDAVEASCNPNHPQAQNPIVYDRDGSLFTDLGFPAGVIGFAGPCFFSTDGTKNSITSALAALNGKFRDGNFANLELTDNEFDAVFIHEFGHFFGLDHSQINQNCLGSLGGCASGSDDAFGLPTMFPFLISSLTEAPGVHPARTLSTDDVAWVSRLYPAASFSSSFGTIQAVIFFSDGTTPGQGFNVIARQVDNPGTPSVNESRRVAVSVVSGYLFTANAGQTVTGDNDPGVRSPLGSRNTSLIGFYEIPGLPPGSYTVEIEGINGAFTGGSGVGPIADLGFQFPLPGPPEFFNNGESSTDNPADFSPVVVSAGGTVSNINLIMNNTPPGLDALEPNTSVGTAAPISNGTTANLSVSPFGNEDFYALGAAANVTVTVEIFAQRLSPPSFLDSVLEIVNASGTRLNLCRPLGSTASFTSACLNDDLTPGSLLDSGLEFRSPSSGTFFIHILDWRGDGRPELQYSLSISGAVNPVPSLSSLSPNSAVAGSGGFTLTVFGSNFVSSSVVRWNGSDRATTFVTPNQVTALIPASDLTNPGTAQVRVFNPAPGGGTSNALTFTIVNPVPSVSSLVPNIVPVGSGAFTLTVNGTGFVNSSVVRWNGSDRTTTLVSFNQITASIPPSDLTSAGTAEVTVFNPSPGGGTSSATLFTINLRNPLPTVTQLSPQSALANSGFTTVLAVTGSNFVFNSQVHWNGIPRATTFVNSTRLTTVILPSEIVSPMQVSVTVISPGPGGGTSNALTFDILSSPDPTPAITSLSPDNATVGAVRDVLLLTVNGSGFVPRSFVLWNGQTQLTTFLGATQLQVRIPATDLTVTGTAQVKVVTPVTPPMGGGTSNTALFTISNPIPVLSSLSPNTVAAGGAGFTLTLAGSNFVPTSVVQWNGAPLTTTFVGSNRLQAAVPAGNIASAGTPSVTVFNPGPGGGTSGSLTFTITGSANPAPTLGSISPATATAGREGLSLTVNGSNFIFGSVVRWNGSDRSTVFVNDTQLKAWVLPSDFPLAGTAQVKVFTPSPGGGESNALTFTVNNPVPGLSNLSPTGGLAGGGSFTLTVRGSGFTPASVVRWGFSDLLTTFVSRNELQAAVPSSNISAAGAVNVTVFNSAPGGGTSNADTFFIISSHVPPTISMLSPSSAKAGREGLTLTVTGTNFDFASVVYWNGSARATTFVSPTELRALIPASDLETAGSVPVKVVNPAGESTELTFTITP